MAAVLAGLRDNPLLHPTTVAGLLDAVPTATVDGQPDGAPVYRQLAPYDPPGTPVSLAGLPGRRPLTRDAVARSRGHRRARRPSGPTGRWRRRSRPTGRTRSAARPRAACSIRSAPRSSGSSARSSLQPPGTITITSSKAQIPISFQNTEQPGRHRPHEAGERPPPLPRRRRARRGAPAGHAARPSGSRSRRGARATSPVQLTVTTPDGLHGREHPDHRPLHLRERCGSLPHRGRDRVPRDLVGLGHPPPAPEAAVAGAPPFVPDRRRPDNPRAAPASTTGRSATDDDSGSPSRDPTPPRPRPRSSGRARSSPSAPRSRASPASCASPRSRTRSASPTLAGTYSYANETPNIVYELLLGGRAHRDARPAVREALRGARRRRVERDLHRLDARAAGGHRRRRDRRAVDRRALHAQRARAEPRRAAGAGDRRSCGSSCRRCCSTASSPSPPRCSTRAAASWPPRSRRSSTTSSSSRCSSPSRTIADGSLTVRSVLDDDGLVLLIGLGTTAGVVVMALALLPPLRAPARAPALPARVAPPRGAHDAAALGVDGRVRDRQPDRAARRHRARQRHRRRAVRLHQRVRVLPTPARTCSRCRS